jgi:putative membrane protein
MVFKSPAYGIILAISMALGAQNRSPKNSAQPKQSFSASDQLFLKALIEEDISEISLAQMALQKSSNADVKQYAQTKILEADPHMRDGAAQVAQKNGMKPPTGPNGRQQEMYKRLENMSGKIFDGAYMTYEADQQTADVKLVQAEIDSTSDVEVKRFVTAEKTPVVEAAASAKEIAAKIASSMTQYKQQPSQTGSGH